jgi:hypothetical protein
MHEREARRRRPEAESGAVGSDLPFGRVQAKLRVGAANDPLEREADHIASMVVRGLSGPLPPAPDLFDSASPTRIRRAPGIVQREDLADLVVKSGSLPELKGAEKTAKEWADLSDIVKPLHKDPETASKIPLTDGYAEVGVISVKPLSAEAESWDWTEKGEGGKGYDNLNATITSSMLSVVKGLMNSNGQMAYVRAQPWFQDKRWRLDIDVNYYPDRGLSQERGLGFHKDSGGNNIFVNLIFNNTTEIPATEYLVDVAEPSPERKALQSKILPKRHLAKVKAARGKLSKENPLAKMDSKISGGVVGPMNYLSWVDDLVWHDTPQMAPRAITEKGTAEVVFKRIQQFVGKDGKGNIPAPYQPLLSALWNTDGTLIQQCKAQGEWWQAYWAASYGKASAEVFFRDCEKVDWSVTLGPRRGEANANDPRLGAHAAKIDEDVEGTKEGRRRANSTAEEQKKVQEAFDKASTEPRSFIRTWVRIVKNKK